MGSMVLWVVFYCLHKHVKSGKYLFLQQLLTACYILIASQSYIMEKTPWETQKAQGSLRYSVQKKNAKRQSVPSRSVHWKHERRRGMRRTADRTTHHRRRTHVRTIAAHGQLAGLESMPRPTSGHKAAGVSLGGCYYGGRGGGSDSKRSSML